MSFSTVETKYIGAESRCTQLLWMKQMLYEHGISQDLMFLCCDNMSAIDIPKNPVQHICTNIPILIGWKGSDYFGVC